MHRYSRFDGKEVRLTTVYGEVFEGEAMWFSSGYGEHEFDVAEEGLEIGDYVFFKSEIRSVKLLKTKDKEAL